MTAEPDPADRATYFPFVLAINTPELFDDLFPNLLGPPPQVKRGPDGRFLSADCEKACQHGCAHPGRFSECDIGAGDA